MGTKHHCAGCDPRAEIIFEGPPKGAKHCEGCPLWDAAKDNGDSCPIYGAVYAETEGEKKGLLCRAPECMDDERYTQRLKKGAK